MTYEQALPPIEPLAEASAPPRQRSPWGYADMAMAIGVVIGATILIAGPAAVVAAVAADGSSVRGDDLALGVLLGANILVEVFLLISVALFTVGKYKVPWAEIGFQMPKRGGWWLPVALLVAALVAVWAFFAALYAFGVEAEGNLPEEVFESLPLIIIVGVLSMGFAPVMEETFFRGFLFGGLRGRWGPLLAALATGFFFALVHIDPLVFVPFTAVGMIFAWGYAYSGSLFPVIAAHFAFNAISFSLGVSGAGT
jgi:membrane protease YdiL (CAAX protease family)